MPRYGAHRRRVPDVVELRPSAPEYLSQVAQEDWFAPPGVPRHRPHPLDLLRGQRTLAESTAVVGCNPARGSPAPQSSFEKRTAARAVSKSSGAYASVV
eukprot:9503007-Pyramimonas_sp.AAC.1